MADLESRPFLGPDQQQQNCPQVYFKINDAIKRADRVKCWGIFILVISTIGLLSSIGELFTTEGKTHRITNAIFGNIVSGLMFYQGYLMFASSNLTRAELQDLTCCHAARITHPNTLNTLKDVEERSEKLAKLILLFTIIYMVLGFIGDVSTLEYTKTHVNEEYE